MGGAGPRPAPPPGPVGAPAEGAAGLGGAGAAGTPAPAAGAAPGAGPPAGTSLGEMDPNTMLVAGWAPSVCARGEARGGCEERRGGDAGGALDVIGFQSARARRPNAAKKSLRSRRQKRDLAPFLYTHLHAERFEAPVARPARECVAEEKDVRAQAGLVSGALHTQNAPKTHHPAGRRRRPAARQRQASRSWCVAAATAGARTHARRVGCGGGGEK